MEGPPHLPDLRHHAEGIFACEEFFGATLINSDGRVVPVHRGLAAAGPASALDAQTRKVRCRAGVRPARGTDGLSPAVCPTNVSPKCGEWLRARGARSPSPACHPPSSTLSRVTGAKES